MFLENSPSMSTTPAFKLRYYNSVHSARKAATPTWVMELIMRWLHVSQVFMPITEVTLHLQVKWFPLSDWNFIMICLWKRLKKLFDKRVATLDPWDRWGCVFVLVLADVEKLSNDTVEFMHNSFPGVRWVFTYKFYTNNADAQMFFRQITDDDVVIWAMSENFIACNFTLLNCAKRQVLSTYRVYFPWMDWSALFVGTNEARIMRHSL